MLGFLFKHHEVSKGYCIANIELGSLASNSKPIQTDHMRILAVPPVPEKGFPLVTPTFSRGFTLTEMAVVLVIVSLLIGGMILPMSAQQDIRQVAETQKSLANIQEALYGFAVVNGRLPRPATSATDGVENPVLCASETACSGFIPWATLGVDKVDAWNKLLRYSVTKDFANGTITLSTIAIRTVQTRDTAGNAVYLAGQATCSATSPCAVAVIFSQGKNRWGTTDTGTALADGSATNTDEDTNNTLASTNFFSRTPTTVTTGGGEFDDIVVWLPTTILTNRMISAGKLP
jgi:prepilin-type N-terminal cleavage/methylation domain-containing protein